MTHARLAPAAAALALTAVLLPAQAPAAAMAADHVFDCTVTAVQQPQHPMHEWATPYLVTVKDCTLGGETPDSIQLLWGDASEPNLNADDYPVPPVAIAPYGSSIYTNQEKWLQTGDKVVGAQANWPDGTFSRDTIAIAVPLGPVDCSIKGKRVRSGPGYVTIEELKYNYCPSYVNVESTIEAWTVSPSGVKTILVPEQAPSGELSSYPIAVPLTFRTVGTWELVLRQNINNPDFFGVFSAEDHLTFTVYATADWYAPSIASRWPASRSTGVRRLPPVKVVFARPVKGVTASTLRLRDVSTGTLVRSTVTYDAATRSAILRPASLLKASHDYKAELTSGIKSYAGISMSATSWRFRTSSDTSRPTVTSKVPANGATGVTQTATIRAKFSEGVRGVSATTFRVRHVTTGAYVAGTVRYDSSTHVARWTPSSPLASGAAYQVVLSAGIRDLRDNAIRVPTWGFRTRT